MPQRDFLRDFTQGFGAVSGIRDRREQRANRQQQLQFQADDRARLQGLREFTGDLVSQPLEQRLNQQQLGNLARQGGNPANILGLRQSQRKSLADADEATQKKFRDSTGRMIGAIHETEDPQIKMHFAQRLLQSAQQNGVDVGPFNTPEAVVQNLPAITRVWGDFDKQLSQRKEQAGIGKTKAETEETKIDTETKAFDLELKKTLGGRDPEKIGTAENQLRNKFLDITKDTRKVQDSFARIQASTKDPSAAGDLALIFNFMKMLDPGSTVREGEFATAENAGGVSTRIRAQLNKVVSGERLSVEQRADFLGQAGGLFESQMGLFNRRAEEFTGVAQRNGLNPENIILGAPQQAEQQQTQPPAGAADLLRSDPSLADQFDRKYGPGSAIRILGQ